MSWGARWLPRAYFGLWFGAEGATTIPAAGPPFIWLVAADGQVCHLAQDQALVALAADGWEARLVDFAEAELLPDGWEADLLPDLVLATVQDTFSAQLAADSFEE